MCKLEALIQNVRELFKDLEIQTNEFLMLANEAETGANKELKII